MRFWPGIVWALHMYVMNWIILTTIALVVKEKRNTNFIFTRVINIDKRGSYEYVILVAYKMQPFEFKGKYYEIRVSMGFTKHQTYITAIAPSSIGFFVSQATLTDCTIVCFRMPESKMIITTCSAPDPKTKLLRSVICGTRNIRERKLLDYSLFFEISL